MSGLSDERPHDILAAEEFGVPTVDPGLAPAHDILAAEEFGVPAGEAGLRRSGPVQLPDEPYPAAEAHDVLAAEEFAMPAGPVGAGSSEGGRARGVGRVAAAVGAAGALVALVLRRRR